MKYIQLKDGAGDKLFPYTKWELIEGKPSILNNVTNLTLINTFLASIPNYKNNQTQVLKHNSSGEFMWVDE